MNKTSLFLGALLIVVSVALVCVTIQHTRSVEKNEYETSIRDSLINMIYSEDENFMDTYGATDQWRDYMSLKNKELMEKIEEND